MTVYRVVLPEFWTGETGREIVACGSVTLAVAFYLLTCPESDSTGVFPVPIPLLAHRIGCPSEGASKGLLDLERIGFIKRREGTDWIFVTKMARYQLGAPLHAKDKRLGRIRQRLCAIRKAGFLNDFLDEYVVAYHLADVPRDEAPPKALARPLEAPSMPLPSHEHEHKHNHEHKHEHEHEEKEPPRTLATLASPPAGGRPETWLTPYLDAWQAERGAKPSREWVARLAKYLRPLDTEHGAERVTEQLRAWLRAHAGDAFRFADLAKFTAGFGGWGQPEPARLGMQTASEKTMGAVRRLLAKGDDP